MREEVENTMRVDGHADTRINRNIYCLLFSWFYFVFFFCHLKMDLNFGNNHFALMESLLTLELNNSECKFPLRSLPE